MTEEKLHRLLNLSRDVSGMADCINALRSEKVINIIIDAKPPEEKGLCDTVLIPQSVKDELCKIIADFLENKLNEYKKEVSKL